MDRRRTPFAIAWLLWIVAFVAIELTALASCGTACTFSAVVGHVEATGPMAAGLVVAALVIIGVHLGTAGRGRREG